MSHSKQQATDSEAKSKRYRIQEYIAYQLGKTAHNFSKFDNWVQQNHCEKITFDQYTSKRRERERERPSEAMATTEKFLLLHEMGGFDDIELKRKALQNWEDEDEEVEEEEDGRRGRRPRK